MKKSSSGTMNIANAQNAHYENSAKCAEVILERTKEIPQQIEFLQVEVIHIWDVVERLETQLGGVRGKIDTGATGGGVEFGTSTPIGTQIAAIRGSCEGLSHRLRQLLESLEV